MSVINRLNDNCVVLATEALVEIVDAFEEELERQPTIAELCEILTWGARSCSRQLVAKASNRGLTISGRATAKANAKLEKGALISIPHSKGANAVLVYLGAFGRFGEAFGIVDELVSRDQSLRTWVPASVQPYPILADDEYIHTGRWSVKAQRPDLTNRFRPFEYFYDPEDDPGDGSYGPYGLAESPSGKLRKLNKKEAAQIFDVVPRRYRHGVYLGADLEAYLRRLLPRSKSHPKAARPLQGISATPRSKSK